MSHQELGREMAARIETDLGDEIVDRIAPAPGRPADGDDDRAEEEVSLRPPAADASRRSRVRAGAGRRLQSSRRQRIGKSLICKEKPSRA